MLMPVDGYGGADVRTPDLGATPIAGIHGVQVDLSALPLCFDLVKLLIPRQGPIAQRRVAAQEARPLKERAIANSGRPPNGRRSAEWRQFDPTFGV